MDIIATTKDDPAISEQEKLNQEKAKASVHELYRKNAPETYDPTGKIGAASPKPESPVFEPEPSKVSLPISKKD